jgi:hypothetical protein
VLKYTLEYFYTYCVILFVSFCIICLDIEYLDVKIVYYPYTLVSIKTYQYMSSVRIYLRSRTACRIPSSNHRDSGMS